MTLTKKLSFAALGTCALVATVSFASAADVYSGESIKDSAPYSTPYIGWAGFYAGGNLGGAFNATEDLELFDEDAVFIGGFHLGYNWQKSSNFVFGLESDISFLDEIDYLSTVRARLGFSSGSTLTYLSGGVAFAEFTDDVFFGDDTDIGYVVGAGLDYKLPNNWSIGGEALYYGFDDPADNGDDTDFWVARARMTYQINYR